MRRGGFGRAATLVLAACAMSAVAFARDDVPPNVGITASAVGSFEMPSIATHPSNPNHSAVAYQGRPPQTCYLARSFDGGETWSQIAVAGKEGLFAFPQDYSTCAYSGIAFARDGTLVYVYSVWKGLYEDARIYVTTLGADAQSFTDPVLLHQDQPLIGYSDFWPSVGVDHARGPNGRIFLTWVHFDCPFTCIQSVMLTSSDDGGRHWSQPVKISSSTSTAPGYPSLGVAPEGHVYVSWAEPLDGNASFYPCLAGLIVPAAPRTDDLVLPRLVKVAASRDGGETFGEPVTAAAATKTDACTPPPFSGPYPVAAGPDGQVHVAFDQPVNGRTRSFVASSSDLGATWSPPQMVGAQALESHDQTHPWVAAASTGELVVGFYSVDPGSAVREVYVANSANGTLARARQVSDAPSNARIPAVQLVPPLRPLFVSVGPGGGCIVWMDSRNGDEINDRADIYFADIEHRGVG